MVDGLTPWIPQRHPLPHGCRVIQLGPDPLFAATPVRGFPCDLALAGDVAASLYLLGEALEPLAARRTELAAGIWRPPMRPPGPSAWPRPTVAPDHPCRRPSSAARLSEALPADAILFSELGCDPSVMAFAEPGSYFGFPPSGGLGWGLPAALGAQLAHPERTVVATVGDGSYLFANPPACHQVAEALGLPVLTVVLNNGLYNAVHKTTRMVYPQGHAARANAMPLTSLQPAPDYVMLARASRGHGERVEAPEALPGALARALEVCEGTAAGAARRGGAPRLKLLVSPALTARLCGTFARHGRPTCSVEQGRGGEMKARWRWLLACWRPSSDSHPEPEVCPGRPMSSPGARWWPAQPMVATLSRRCSRTMATVTRVMATAAD